MVYTAMYISMSTGIRQNSFIFYPCSTFIHIIEIIQKTRYVWAGDLYFTINIAESELLQLNTICLQSINPDNSHVKFIPNAVYTRVSLGLGCSPHCKHMRYYGTLPRYCLPEYQSWTIGRHLYSVPGYLIPVLNFAGFVQLSTHNFKVPSRRFQYLFLSNSLK